MHGEQGTALMLPAEVAESSSFSSGRWRRPGALHDPAGAWRSPASSIAPGCTRLRSSHESAATTVPGDRPRVATPTTFTVTATTAAGPGPASYPRDRWCP